MFDQVLDFVFTDVPIGNVTIISIPTYVLFVEKMVLSPSDQNLKFENSLDIQRILKVVGITVIL